MTSGFVHEHPYLLSDLAMLATIAFGWWVAGPQRQMVLLSGAVRMPFFLFAAALNDGTYWSPRHLELAHVTPIRLFGAPAGLEDLLFLFAAGARTWFFATLPAQRRWMTTAGPSLSAAPQ